MNIRIRTILYRLFHDVLGQLDVESIKLLLQFNTIMTYNFANVKLTYIYMSKLQLEIR